MAVISYIGRTRGDTECRNILQENVQMTPQGISVTIPREDKAPKAFYLSNDACEDGINFASIIHIYKEALKSDNIPVFPNSPFLFTGRSKKDGSTFVNSALGKHYLSHLITLLKIL